MKRPPVIVVQLVHLSGPMKGQMQDYPESVITIGRQKSCHLCFPADMTEISRTHAEIIRDGNQFKVVDHSRNGTFVNGKRISEAYLKSGDVLMFTDNGPKVSFLTEMRETDAEPERPLPQPTQPEEVRRQPVREERPAPVAPPHLQPAREAPVSVQPQRVLVSLTVQYGPTIRTFKELPVTLGRSRTCQCMIDSPALYDQQAEIFFADGRYWIKDLTGQKLVLIHGRPVETQAPLNENDDVALSPGGPFFRFLGDGRLAEIEAGPDVGAGRPAAGQQVPSPPEKPEGKKEPFFKKLFK